MPPLVIALRGGARVNTRYESRPDRLIVREDAAGPRHFLDGRPVALGDVLEIKVGDEWLAVRYHCLFRLDLAPTLMPIDEDRIGVDLPDASSASLRWPKG